MKKQAYCDLQIHGDLQLDRKLIMGCANLSVEHDDEKNHVAITLANTTSGTAINFLKITGADNDGSLNIYCSDTTTLIDSNDKSIVHIDRQNEMLTTNYQTTFTALTAFTGMVQCQGQLQCEKYIYLKDTNAPLAKQLIGSIRGQYDTSLDKRMLELCVNETPGDEAILPKLQVTRTGPCWQHASGVSHKIPVVWHNSDLNSLTNYSNVGDILVWNTLQKFELPGSQGWILIYQIGNNNWQFGRLVSSDQTVTAIGIRLW